MRPVEGSGRPALVDFDAIELVFQTDAVAGGERGLMRNEHRFRRRLGCRPRERDAQPECGNEGVHLSILTLRYFRTSEPSRWLYIASIIDDF
jgi:hypothetical protein